jgi:hypothetical protein
MNEKMMSENVRRFQRDAADAIRSAKAQQPKTARPLFGNGAGCQIAVARSGRLFTTLARWPGGQWPCSLSEAAALLAFWTLNGKAARA